MLLFAKHYTSNIGCTLVGNKNCWSLRCSWSITCRCCSNYVFNLHLMLGFSGFGKQLQDQMRNMQVLGLVQLILDVWQEFISISSSMISHFKPKCHKISFTHNLFFSCPTILKFCIEYDSALCNNFKMTWGTGRDVMDVTWCGFMMSLVGYPIL